MKTQTPPDETQAENLQTGKNRHNLVGFCNNVIMCYIVIISANDAMANYEFYLQKYRFQL